MMRILMTVALEKRLNRVHEKVANAAARVGRELDSILLIAVSKTWPPEVVETAIRAGQAIFGENHVQEAVMKMNALDKAVSWHLVGHLQTNKVNDVVGRFDLIHSVDSTRLLLALNRRAEHLNCTQDVLIQLNLSGEESKHGLAGDQLPGMLDQCAGLEHVSCRGFMILPPYSPDPESSRHWFIELREILESHVGHPGLNGRCLSMGMSSDFEAAVEEGATHLRVGTAIFGERNN
jgi:pyridoxal phosphate enzyme (YggS family)